MLWSTYSQRIMAFLGFLSKGSISGRAVKGKSDLAQLIRHGTTRCLGSRGLTISLSWKTALEQSPNMRQQEWTWVTRGGEGINKSPKGLLFLKGANLYKKFVVLPPRVSESSKYLCQQSPGTASRAVTCFTNQHSEVAYELEAEGNQCFYHLREE